MTTDITALLKPRRNELLQIPGPGGICHQEMIFVLIPPSNNSFFFRRSISGTDRLGRGQPLGKANARSAQVTAWTGLPIDGNAPPCVFRDRQSRLTHTPGDVFGGITRGSRDLHHVLPPLKCGDDGCMCMSLSFKVRRGYPQLDHAPRSRKHAACPSLPAHFVKSGADVLKQVHS